MKLNPYKKYFIAMIIVLAVLGSLLWSWGEYALMLVIIGFLMGIAFMLFLKKGFVF